MAAAAYGLPSVLAALEPATQVALVPPDAGKRRYFTVGEVAAAPGSAQALVAFEECRTRDEAERLRGKTVLVAGVAGAGAAGAAPAGGAGAAPAEKHHEAGEGFASAAGMGAEGVTAGSEGAHGAAAAARAVHEVLVAPSSVMGARVVDVRLGELGEVTSLEVTPAHPLLVVEGTRGETLIPVVEAFLSTFEAGTLTVRVPRGLVPGDEVPATGDAYGAGEPAGTGSASEAGEAPHAL